MNEMKDMYVKPNMECMSIETVEMLAVSSVEYTSDKASSEHEALSNDRRGWGDLWSNE